jgi:type IV secretion system protein TrbJ
MKRYLFLASVAFAPLLMAHSTPANAVVVECANCADLEDQLISDAKQAQQYLTQLDQYKTQLQQYANMVQNTTQLPQAIWAQVTSDIMQVRNITNAASLLTGNSGSIISRLQSAGGYLNQATRLPTNIGSQFTMWQQTLANSSNSLGRTLGVQQGQEQNYASLLTAIDAQSQNADGQLKAIQAGNEMASLTSQQLNQIQATLTAASQEAATRDNIAAERQGVADAYGTQFLSQGYQQMTGPAYQ